MQVQVQFEVLQVGRKIYLHTSSHNVFLCGIRFQEFVTKYGRVYADAKETAMRFDTFVAHAEGVAEVRSSSIKKSMLNSENSDGNAEMRAL